MNSQYRRSRALQNRATKLRLGTTDKLHKLNYSPSALRQSRVGSLQEFRGDSQAGVR